MIKTNWETISKIFMQKRRFSKDGTELHLKSEETTLVKCKFCGEIVCDIIERDFDRIQYKSKCVPISYCFCPFCGNEMYEFVLDNYN